MSKGLSKQPIKILVWSPLGDGYSYWGPAISHRKLVESGKPDHANIVVDMASPHFGKLQQDVFDARYSLPLPKGIPRMLWYYVRSFILIYRIAKNSHYDQIHVLGFHMISFLPALIMSFLKLPVFLKVPNHKSGLSRNSRLSTWLGIAALRKRFASHIHGYIAISEEIYEELVGAGIPMQRIHRIPNGVKLPEQIPVKTFGFPLKLITIGEISTRKHQMDISNAVLRNADDRLTYTMVGPVNLGITDRDQFEKMVKSHESLKHESHTQDTETWLNQADVFILLSDSEGMSNALLEAMAHALPVIVNKVSGSRELVVNSQGGWLIDDITPNSIAAALQMVMESTSDQLKELGLRGHEYVKTHNKMDRVFERYLRLTC